MESDLPYELVDTLGNLISKRIEIRDWCQNLIKDIKIQEIAVNSTKTASAVAGVIGFGLLFTPFAPIGLATLGASGVAAIATSIGDFIGTKVKNSSLMTQLETDKNLTEKLKKELDQANKVIERLKDQYKLTDAQATLIVYSSIQNAGKVVISGVQIFESLEKIAEVAHLTKALSDLSRIGAFVEETSAALLLARTVSTAGRVLSGVGAIFGIADTVYSWLVDNPTKSSAMKAVETLDMSINEMSRMRDGMLRIRSK